ncbi:hypothetical protein, partial [Parvibaculum sp.]|uniref:hypothetical protein n=1 Tax=Parvibaculum sp. TaxID=2024848 RepID=UPI003918C47B
MCFNKSKSASSNASSSVNRDERIALDGGSDALVLKEIAGGNNATANLNVQITDASGEVLALQNNFLTGAFGLVDNAFGVAEGALEGAGGLVAGALESLLSFAGERSDAALTFAAQSGQRADQFAASTQAAYASTVRDEMTNDLTQV